MIRKYDTFTFMRGLKMKPVKGADRVYYIDFGQVFKVLTKRAMRKNNINKFKLTSQKLKMKMKQGWEKQQNALSADSKKTHKNKNKKSKDLMTQINAACIIQSWYLKSSIRNKEKSLRIEMDTDPMDTDSK